MIIMLKVTKSMHSRDKNVNILIAYEVLIACELYAQALNRCAAFHVVAHTTTARGAVEAARRNKIDVALISAKLSEGSNSALVLLKTIRNYCPQTKLIVLLDRSNLNLVVAAFHAGARGVFDASQDVLKRLCRCVEKVDEGQIWATSAELVQVLEAFSQRLSPRIVNHEGTPLLTRREEEVVQLVAEGLTNRQVAAELNLSEHTVRNNLFRIFDKLGISTRVELALRFANSSYLSDQSSPQADDLSAGIAGISETFR